MVLIALLAAGCSFEPASLPWPFDGSRDATGSDGQVAEDAQSNDAATTDVAQPDSSVADDAMRDAQSDAALTDAAMDARLDAALPDASPPDAMAIDATVPDARPPDTGVPDARPPDASPLDATGPCPAITCVYAQKPDDCWGPVETFPPTSSTVVSPAGWCYLACVKDGMPKMPVSCSATICSALPESAGAAAGWPGGTTNPTCD